MIVGEDLGTVTPQIRQALDHFGIYGYKVPYFEKNDRGEFRRPGAVRRAGAGRLEHARPADAGGLLDGPRH